MKYYRKAAKCNDDKALLNMGLCYKYGEGVTQSNRWAKHYFEKAEFYGNRRAKKQLKELEKIQNSLR